MVSRSSGMMQDTCDPTRSLCPGASREEQQVRGTHVFPIPVKHGSRNPHKQELQTIDKTMLTTTRRHTSFVPSHKGRVAECRRSAGESSQQATRCASLKTKSRGQNDSWRKIHPDTCRRRRPKVESSPSGAPLDGWRQSNGTHEKIVNESFQRLQFRRIQKSADGAN